MYISSTRIRTLIVTKFVLKRIRELQYKNTCIQTIVKSERPTIQALHVFDLNKFRFFTDVMPSLECLTVWYSSCDQSYIRRQNIDICFVYQEDFLSILKILISRNDSFLTDCWHLCFL